MTIKNARAGQGFAYPENSSDDISVIKFEDTKVRIVKILGEPWFVAADVCAALEITDHKVALRRLDGDEKGECLIPVSIPVKRTIHI